MSLFYDLKRLITGEMNSTQPMTPPSIGELAESNNPAPSVGTPHFWPLTSGTSHNVHQERNVSYCNNQISGRCVGRIGELKGALMLYPFEDMPAWLTSLQVRLTVETEAGDVRVSLLEPSGSITTLTAPCTLAGQFAVTNGRLALRCETDATSARGLCYEAVII